MADQVIFKSPSLKIDPITTRVGDIDVVRKFQAIHQSVRHFIRRPYSRCNCFRF